MTLKVQVRDLFYMIFWFIMSGVVLKFFGLVAMPVIEMVQIVLVYTMFCAGIYLISEVEKPYVFTLDTQSFIQYSSPDGKVIVLSENKYRDYDLLVSAVPLQQADVVIHGPTNTVIKNRYNA